MSILKLTISLLLTALFAVGPGIAATGSWNGIGFTAWNGVAITAWNGTSISTAGGGGISWSELTQGTNTTASSDSASISPTANALVLVTCGWSVVGGGTITGSETVTVSGCGLTWVEVDRIVFEGRRMVVVVRGSAASPSSGVVTMAFTDLTGTFEQVKYSIDQATNVNATPIGTPVDGTGATPLTLGDVGTIDAGDYVFFAFASDTDAAMTPGAGTTLTAINDATGVRALLVGYNNTDDTPSASAGPGGAVAGIAFLVEKQ